MTNLFRFFVLMCWILFNSVASAQFFSTDQPKLLHESEAFQADYVATSSGLSISWLVAPDYYMYRDQFQVVIKDDAKEWQAPLSFKARGVIEDDPEFGQVEVFFVSAEFEAEFPEGFTPIAKQQYQITLKGQGCNKPVGICYPPLDRDIQLSWSAELLSDSESSPRITEQPAAGDQPAATKSVFAYIVSAFIAGILLSFTPCVLPMIPILSGVIAKQHAPNKLRAGWLSICYVGGTVVTYMIAGWLAGATGMQLQAQFQSPLMIGFICLLLVILALSLFGVFHIQTPASLSNKVHANPTDAGSDRFLSGKSFLLGLVSALVVGACVSPILVVVLGTAITQGDPLLGSLMMGAMAVGMGVLLILFGFGAGWILPRTGPWMKQIQTLFGFMVLAAAIYIATALDAVPILLLWSLLLLSVGFYLWQLANTDSATENQGLANSLGKALSLLAIVWGVLALIGHATGGREITAPLSELSLSENSKQYELPFVTTTTLEQTQQQLELAKQSGKPVLLDFYADWCLDCKRMKRTTFREPSVADVLSGWVLIEADVTNTSSSSEELKRFFNVFGPPATLFFTADGLESAALRQYGYIAKDEFIALATQNGASKG